MSELNSIEASAPPLPSSLQSPGQDKSPGQDDKEQAVRGFWSRFVRRIRAYSRPYNRPFFGEAIRDIAKVVRMLEALSDVIKDELVCHRNGQLNVRDLLPRETPEEAAFGRRLDAMRLKALSFEVDAALRYARVSLKIAERMGYENETDDRYSWDANDLEIWGETENILRCLPNKDCFYLIETDRAYEAFTRGRLKEVP